MNAVIIYKGKYGATKQYASWLGEELGLPMFDAESISGAQLDKFDTLLIGSSVYIGKLQIKKWLRDNLHLIMNKKIFFFQIAATPPEQADKRQAYNLSSIPAEVLGNCSFYFLLGKMVMKNLSWKDKFMLKMGSLIAKKPSDKKAMLTDYDYMNKNSLGEMINDVKKYSNKGIPKHFFSEEKIGI